MPSEIETDDSIAGPSVAADDGEPQDRTPPPGAAGLPGEAGRRRSRALKILQRPELGAVAGAVIVWAVFAVIARERGFLTFEGTLNYLEVSAEIGILVSAVALIMIAGEFDLSVGSMIGAAGILVAAPIVELGWPLWAALLFAFSAAALIGLLNGYLVVRTGLEVVHHHSGLVVHLARSDDRHHRASHRFDELSAGQRTNR